MKKVLFPAIIIALLATCGCKAPALTGTEGDFINPAAAVLAGGYTPVPRDVIARLPVRIGRLPVKKSIRGEEFLSLLGLKEYAANISGGVRHNSHFMKLDREHFLEIMCDPETLAVSRVEVERLTDPNTPSHIARRIRYGINGLGSDVVGCVLCRGKQVVVKRWLEESTTEQATPSDDDKPSN